MVISSIFVNISPLVLRHQLLFKAQFSSVSNLKTKNPAVVAWPVERLLHKKCHLLVVDQIPLGSYAWYGN